MKEKMKKILVFALVLAMVTSNSLTAFATENLDGNTEEVVYTGLDDCAAAEHEETCAAAIAEAAEAEEFEEAEETEEEAEEFEEAEEETEDSDAEITNEETQTDNDGVMQTSLEEQSEEVSGTLETGVVTDKAAVTGDSYIYFDICNLSASESIEIKLYSGETFLSSTVLNQAGKDKGYLNLAAISAKVEITDDSSSWDTTWAVAPIDNLIPDKAVLYIDGVETDEANVRMYSADVPSDAREWGDIEGVAASPKGTITPGYVTDHVWGEAGGNAKESFEIKIYSDNTLLATTKLLNIDGIIDGDVYVTWNAYIGEHNDGYWETIWEENGLVWNKEPDRVELYVDGVKVAENQCMLSSPDNLNPVKWWEINGVEGAPIEQVDKNGNTIGKFDSLAAACEQSSEVEKIVINCDISEDLTDPLIYGNIVSGVETGVTITNTNSTDYIYLEDLTIGSNVTIKSSGVFFQGGTNVVNGTIVVTEENTDKHDGVYYQSGDAKVTVKDGGSVSVDGSTILRYNQKSDAGLFIYGDGNDETVEFDNHYYIGAYSGTFYAENANVETGYFLLKNSYDNSSYADVAMTLNDSSLKVVGTTDGQNSFIIDDQASLTLSNGASIEDVRDFNILTDANVTVNVDENSSIAATNLTIADNVNLDATQNEDGTWNIFKKIKGLAGEGTEAKPFLIGSADELIWLQEKVDELAADGSTQFAGKYFKLTDDIDLAGINWNPIGSMDGDHGSFKGVFNGDGHTISNLNVQQAGNGLGLFARTAGNAEIKNLTLNNVTVKSTNNSNYVGGVVGNSYASTKITNVHVTGNIDISGRGYIGGISGHGYVVMDNVSVVGEGTISSTFWCAGGILGYGGEGATNIMNAHVEGTGDTGLTITSAAGGLGAIVGMAEDNEGTQPISGSNLSAKNVNIKTYTGAYGDSYANYALGCLYGGNSTSKLTGNLKAENVVVETSTGETPKIVDIVARIDNAYYYKVTDALEAVEDGQTIIIMNKEGSEVDKEIEFSKSGTFTITGEAPDYKLPIITVTNETGTTVLNIENATLAMAEIDARKNATINVIDSTIKGANGNDIVKAYYNGVINVSGTSEIDTMQVTVMGRLNLSDSAKITATWQTNVYGNGIVTINEGATLDTAALYVTGQPYSNRDNTDADRIGKPATILVDGGILKTLDYDHAYYYEADNAVIGADTTYGLIEVINGGMAQLNQSNGVTINSGSAIKIDEGSFTAKSKAGTSLVTVNGTLEMNEAEFEGAILVNDAATADIKNVNIINTDETHSAIETMGILTLTDAEITSARHAVRVEGGTTTINGGIYETAGTAGMTTHAINAGGGTAEAKVVINGGTFIGPKGTAADSGAAVKVQENATVEIMDGAFAGGKNDTLAVKGTLTVYGGQFDQKVPEMYLAEGKVCVEGTYPYEGVIYPYAVADAEAVKSVVDIEVKDNKTSVSGTFTSEEAEKAAAIAKSVAVDEYTLLASVGAVRAELAASEETAKDAKKALEAENIEITNTTVITTLVKPYMQIVMKELNEEAVNEVGKTIIGFEMKMLYDVVATTDPANMITDPNAEGYNTVTISEGNEVKKPEAANISFEVLADLIDANEDLEAKERVLYVEHLKADSSVYNHEADLEEGTDKDMVSFYNDKGYSTFNLKLAENDVPADKPFQPTGGGSGSSDKDSDSDKKNDDTVEVYYAGNTAQAGSASTGDMSNTVLWTSVMGLAAAAVVTALIFKKRSSK